MNTEKTNGKKFKICSTLPLWGHGITGIPKVQEVTKDIKTEFPPHETC